MFCGNFSCFDDPCYLHALEQAEEQSLSTHLPVDTHAGNHHTSGYDGVPPEEHHSPTTRRWRIWYTRSMKSAVLTDL